MSVTIGGVDFLTVFVKDFDAALAFYGEVLGLRCSSRYERIPGAEFETGTLTLQVIEAAAIGREFTPRGHPLALRVDDVDQARAALEAKGVSFMHQFDSRVCHNAVFADPDGNVLLLHHRYAPRDPG